MDSPASYSLQPVVRESRSAVPFSVPAHTPVSGRCDDKRVVGRWSVGRHGVKEDSECSLSPVSLDYKRLPCPPTLPVAGKELMTYLGREMEDTQDLIEQSFTLFINLHFASSSVGPSRTLRSLTVGGREGEG